MPGFDIGGEWHRGAEVAHFRMLPLRNRAAVECLFGDIGVMWRGSKVLSADLIVGKLLGCSSIDLNKSLDVNEEGNDG